MNERTSAEARFCLLSHHMKATSDSSSCRRYGFAELPTGCNGSSGGIMPWQYPPGPGIYIERPLLEGNDYTHCRYLGRSLR